MRLNIYLPIKIYEMLKALKDYMNKNNYVKSITGIKQSNVIQFTIWYTYKQIIQNDCSCIKISENTEQIKCPNQEEK